MALAPLHCHCPQAPSAECHLVLLPPVALTTGVLLAQMTFSIIYFLPLFPHQNLICCLWATSSVSSCRDAEGHCLIGLELQLLQEPLDEFCRGQRCHIGWGSCIGSIGSLRCNSVGTAGAPRGSVDPPGSLQLLLLPGLSMPGQLQFPTGYCSFMWRFSGVADRRFLLLLHPEVGNSQDSTAHCHSPHRILHVSSFPKATYLFFKNFFVFSQSSSVHMSCLFSWGILIPSSSSLPLYLAEPVSPHCNAPGERDAPPHSIISRASQQCHRTQGCGCCATILKRRAEMTLLQCPPSPGHDSISLGCPAGLQATHQTYTPFL